MVENSNWLEEKTLEELERMKEVLEYQYKDIPSVRDKCMAQHCIRLQLNPIIKEINKRKEL